MLPLLKEEPIVKAQTACKSLSTGGGGGGEWGDWSLSKVKLQPPLLGGEFHPPPKPELPVGEGPPPPLNAPKEPAPMLKWPLLLLMLSKLLVLLQKLLPLLSKVSNDD